MSDDTPITGIDVPAVTAWFTEHTDAAPPLAFELIAGGRSNLTFRVTDTAGGAWVLRRPPTGHVLATAHETGLSGPGRLHDLFVTHEAMPPGAWKGRGGGLVNCCCGRC